MGKIKYDPETEKELEKLRGEIKSLLNDLKRKGVLSPSYPFDDDIFNPWSPYKDQLDYERHGFMLLVGPVRPDKLDR